MQSELESIPNYPEFELEQAAARLGLTPSDVEMLLDSEVSLEHLLDYVSAVITNRMN
jgi:hypothetical protein